MHHIVNTNPNSSTNVNGVEFTRDEEGRLVSVQPVGGEALDIFLNVPGFFILEQSKGPEQAAVAKAQPEQPAQPPASEVAADAGSADAAAAAGDTGAVSEQPEGTATEQPPVEQPVEQPTEKPAAKKTAAAKK
jgi:hypothetical protein